MFLLGNVVRRSAPAVDDAGSNTESTGLTDEESGGVDQSTPEPVSRGNYSPPKRLTV